MALLVQTERERTSGSAGLCLGCALLASEPSKAAFRDQTLTPVRCFVGEDPYTWRCCTALADSFSGSEGGPAFGWCLAVF